MQRGWQQPRFIFEEPMTTHNPNTPVLKNQNLYVLFSVTLIAVMGVTTVAPAFPKIQQALGISTAEVSLLITAFTLPGIALAPVLGVLADRFGRKRIIVPSLLMYALAGTACAFTTDLRLLVLFRFLQGAGASSLSSLNLTILGDIFHGRQRVEAMGYNGTVLSLGTALYPAIGGAIAMLGWHFPFLLSLFALPVAAAVLLVLKNPEPVKNTSLKEYIGNAFAKVRQRNVIVLYGATLATFILLYGIIITYLPFYLSDRFAATPAVIGLVISSASIATSVASFNIGRITAYIHQSRLIGIAFLLYVASFGITWIAPSIPTIIPAVMIFGFANGINIPSTQALLASYAPMEYRGAFMSVNSMVLRLGQTVGPMLFAMIMPWGGVRGVLMAGIVFSLLVSLFMFLLFQRQNTGTD